MISDWETHTIGDFLSHRKGFAFKSTQYKTEGRKIARVSNFTQRSIDTDGCNCIDEGEANQFSEYILKAGDVVIATVGSWPTNPASVVGRAVRVPEEANGLLLNQNAVRLRSNEHISQQFLFYLLSAEHYQNYIVSTAQGSASQASIKLKDIFAYQALIPPLSEQKSIVSLLGALDDKIENNRRMNKTLEEMAQAIFKSWFVDFDPVHAKVTGNAPAHMDADTAALFPSSFGDDGLPMGWEKKSYGDLVSNTIGGDWGKEKEDDKHSDQVYIIRGTDIPSVRNNSKGKVPLRWVDPKKLATRKLYEGDIVIEVSGGSPTQPTGRAVFITTEVLDRFEFPLIPTSFCRLMRPKEKKYALLLHLHLSNLYQNGGTWEYQNQSTGIANFQTKYFLSKESVIVPSDQILAAFDSLTLSMLKKANNNENIILADLRDTLLPKLMSGEIHVADAEGEVEAAL